MQSVVFVCLGNICRSPLAEAAFRAICKDRGVNNLRIESRGTSDWHQGQGADDRMIRTGAAHGLSLESHIARQVRPADFSEFDLIVAMDRKNERDLLGQGVPREKLSLLRDFDRADTGRDVPDPYFGGARGFEDVYQMIWRCSEVLFDEQVRRKDEPDEPVLP